MSEEIFKKFESRLRAESCIKAMLCGLLTGFSAMIICAVACWFFGFKGIIWLSFTLFGVIAVATALSFYFFAFRPTPQRLARRIDSLGLDERIITMHELEGSSSYIAQRQRDDALKALSKIDPKIFALAISVPLIVATSVTCALGVGATVGMSFIDKSAMEMIQEANTPAPKYYDINYSAEDGGSIFGETKQKILAGEDGKMVVAFPEAGYMFAGWSDGVASAIRSEDGVKKNIDVVANFVTYDGDNIPVFNDLPLVNGGNGGGGGESSTNGDDSPFPPKTSNNGGGDGSGDSDNSTSQNNPANKVFDGNTFYGDAVFDNAYSETLKDLSSRDDVSDQDKEAIDDYYENIEK